MQNSARRPRPTDLNASPFSIFLVYGLRDRLKTPSFTGFGVHVEFSDAFHQAPRERRIRMISEKRLRMAEPERIRFFNINTAQDIELARQWIAGIGPLERKTP